MAPDEAIIGFNLRLPESMLRELEQIAREQHRPTSAQMRVAISEHLDRNRQAA